MRLVLTLLAAVALSPAIAHAQAPQTGPSPSAPDRARAAALFDAGVAHHQKAEYVEAARSFLQADAIAPSPIAITNAIADARKASDHLMVARAAERAIARGDAVVEAREALADAATRLGRLELACDVAGCTMLVDGEKAGSSAYVLPGTHRIEARAAGATAEERVVCVAGAAYRIALHPAAAKPTKIPEPPPDRPVLPRVLFFTGAGATLVLGIVTAWSGADALSAKHALPAMPVQAQEDDVWARAHRTTGLLAATVVLAGGTAAAGVWAFRDGRAAAAVAPLPGGATIAFSGRFGGP